MILGVLTKVFQLFKSATSQHLTQKQKEPIDLLLLLRNYGLRAVLLLAELACGKNRVHPNTGSPIVHGALVIEYEHRNLIKLLFEIIRHLVLPLATLALNLPGDSKQFLTRQVIIAMDGGSVSGGPREWGWDSLALSLSWHLGRVSANT